MTDSALTGTEPAREPGGAKSALREQLDQAVDNLAAAEYVLTARAPRPADLHAAVEGAMRLSNALAGLLTAVIRQAPASLDHSAGPILDELLADLRGMHGCLITGPLLLAPACEDLDRLIANPATDPEGGPAMAHDPDPVRDIPVRIPVDEAADHDVADQQRPAWPDPDGEQDIYEGAEVLDADPADVADQRRDAPVLDETEPWP